jgi:four helix bundle protein
MIRGAVYWPDCAAIGLSGSDGQLRDLTMPPYERFLAWQACHELNLSIARATDSWPSRERFELTAQLRRAAWSAVANIVEGSSRRGSREFRRFLDISLGSLAEIEYGLRFARDRELIASAAYLSLEETRAKAARLTWGLYDRVRRATS